MNDFETTLAVQMRKAELQRRVARQNALVKNHVALMNEDLSEVDARVNTEAIKQLQTDTLALEKAFQPSYWKRLWAALRGK